MRDKRGLLFDHDGVLVDTECWYFEANRLALAELGLRFSQALYPRLMADGKSRWDWALGEGCSEEDASRGRARRDILYGEMLDTQSIEIPGVPETLAALAKHFRMAIVTTSPRQDFSGACARLDTLADLLPLLDTSDPRPERNPN